MDCILCVICWDCYHITLSLYLLSLLHWYFYWCMYFKRAKWWIRTGADGHKTCGTIWHYLDGDFVLRLLLEILDVLLTVVGSIFLLNFPQNTLKKLSFLPQLGEGNFCRKTNILLIKILRDFRILRWQYTYSLEIAVSCDQKHLEILTF